MTVLFVLAAVIVLVLIIAANRPDAFRIERRATIQAPPAVVYAKLADFHAWAEWSPWEKLDPAMQRSFSGPAQGMGAIYAWEGNKQVGAGRMEITDASPSARLVIKLEFFRPWKATNTSEFSLGEQGGSTTVLWAMLGPQPFMSKLMGMFMNFDKMVGKDFEAGLAQLKAACEK